MILKPLKPALIAGLAHTVLVLVRVQAPDADPSVVPVRQPYHLSLVIDRSGSMSGKPLQEAVRCSRHIVDRLLPTDVASLVSFDHRATLLAPAQPVGKESLYTAMKMRSRVASKDEGQYDAVQEAVVPRFLRRDGSQGTKGGRPRA